jgi:hypothetical protein
VVCSKIARKYEIKTKCILALKYKNELFFILKKQNVDISQKKNLFCRENPAK